MLKNLQAQRAMAEQPNRADFNRLVDNLRTALDPVFAIKLLGGVLLEAEAITTATTAIEHKLGRTPVGWILCDQDTDSRVWRTAWDTTTITLDCSANCTINLWVY